MSTQVIGDALWALLAAATLVALADSHLATPHLARLSTLVRRIEASRLGYGAVLLCWAWLGWHFFAR
ncbi:MAG: DUF6186 family protein [Acidimicrobiales bacterium]